MANDVCEAGKMSPVVCLSPLRSSLAIFSSSLCVCVCVG